ncbi:MAG: hypothetical protein NUW14_09700 [Deltaproteobacteria bacterium]|nr:hypothetical protein [Deltaproteobacteria bacterium]
MSAHVILPVWAVAVLALLAALAAVDRLLLPGVRWFLRRRVNIVLDEIGKRLHLEIRPFTLTKRQVLIDRLMYDPKVLEAAGAHAGERGIPRDVVMTEVERYAREIVPAFNAYAYFRMGYWFARRAARLLYRVRVGFTDEEGLSRVDPKSTVVFVMNHRSNMDYVLVAYLAATSLKFLLRNLLLMLQGRWYRFGYACVNFGSPLSMRSYSLEHGIDLRILPKEERFLEVEKLAASLMREVGKVVPVLPVSLVATALLRRPDERRSELELKADALRIIEELSAAGAHIYIPRADQDYAVTVGLRMLTLRKLVSLENGLYAPLPEELPLIRYYANSIRHLFPETTVGG